jgi:hypothetical protein
MTSIQYEAYLAQQQRHSDLEDELAEKMKATVDIQRKFQMLMAEFAIFVEPVVDMLRDMLEYLHKGGSLWDYTAVQIAAAAGGAMLLIFALGPLLQLLTVIGTVAGPMMAASIGKIGVISGPAAPPTAAFGIALLKVGLGFLAAGAGIGIAAAGIGFMVMQMAKLAEIGWPAAAAIFAISAGMVGMSFAVASLANPLSAAGIGLFVLAMGALALIAGTVISSATVLAKAIGGITTSLAKLKDVDTEELFTGITSGMEKLDKFLTENEERKIRITSTLENLALLNAGRASQSATQTGMNTVLAISEAKKEIIGKFKLDIDMKIDGHELKTYLEPWVEAKMEEA